MTEITVRYRSIDRFSKTRKFKTLAGAQKFAQSYVGETPDLGSSYAVSFDGIGRITVSGCTLAELFPRSADHHAPCGPLVDVLPTVRCPEDFDGVGNWDYPPERC